MSLEETTELDTEHKKGGVEGKKWEGIKKKVCGRESWNLGVIKG